VATWEPELVYCWPNVFLSLVASVLGRPLQGSDERVGSFLVIGCLEVSRRRGGAGGIPFESGLLANAACDLPRVLIVSL
jgi:hypothetical protein